MSGRGTLALLLLAVALGSFYYLYEIRGGEARSKAKEEAGRIFHLQAEEVKEVRVAQGADTLLVERGAEGWRMRRPVDAPADEEVVENALDSFLSGQRQETLQPAAGEGMDVFGLDPPAIDVLLTPVDSAGVDSAAHLQLGDLNPTGSFAYARVPGSPAILLVGSSMRRAFDGDLGRFRDHTVMPLELPEVGGVRVLRAGRSTPLVVERGEGDQWRITAPVACRADHVKVEQLLRQLKSAKVERFVSESPASLVPYGLDKPAFTLTIEMRDGARRTLRLGKEAPDSGGRYGTREEGPVFTVADPSLLSFLARDAAELRDRNLVDFDQGVVQGVTLRAGGKEWRLARGEDDSEALPASTWSVEGSGQALDAGRVSTFLWDVKRTVYEKIVKQTVDDAASYGLDPAAREFVLRDADGAELGRLRLGKAWRTDAGDSLVYAMNGEEETLYAVSAQSAQRLPSSIEDLLPDQDSTTSGR